MATLGTPHVVKAVSLEILSFYFCVIFYCKWRLNAEVTTDFAKRSACTTIASKPLWSGILLLWRLAVLAWFATWAFADWIHNDWKIPLDFTSWTFRLQPIYWFFAVACSVMHFATAPIKQRRLRMFVNAATQICFEICLPTAWFITLAVFGLLDPGNPIIFHDRMHFVNTVLLTVEFCFSGVCVHSLHLPTMITWILLYACTSWTRKASDDHYKFQYFFLELSDSMALIWYGLLFSMATLIYLVFAGLSKIKHRRLALLADHGSDDDQVGDGKSVPHEDLQGEQMTDVP